MVKNKDPVQKKYFDVRVECTLPAVLSYRVLAEDPQQAITMIKNLQPNSIRHRLLGRKDIKILVYDAGGSVIRLIKHLLGR
jgi:hypothetical protein